MTSTLPPEVVQNLKRPIHAFFHMDAGWPCEELATGYWTYAKKGLLPDDDGVHPGPSVFDVEFKPPPFTMCVPMRYLNSNILTSAGTSRVANHPSATKYLQFERRDFIECYNPEMNWTFREPETPFQPPPKKETEDVKGISVPFRGRQFEIYRAKPDGTKDRENSIVTLMEPDGTMI